MKRALLLCAAINAAVILGGCANQNSSATTSGASGLAQQGAVNSGAGVGGGGVPGRVPMRYQP